MADLAPVVGGESPRLRALRNLSNQLPAGNAQVAAGQQAARDIQLQAAARQMKPGQATVPAAQQAGAALQANAGTQAVQAAQQNLQAQGQIAQTGLAEQQQAAKSQAASNALSLEGQNQDQISRFSQLSAAAKKEMFDDRVQFTRDEQGRALLDERKLADYARGKAQSDEEFRDYAQKSDQLSRRKLAMMNAVQGKIEQQMKQDAAEASQISEELASGKLTAAQYASQKKLAEEKAKTLEGLAQTRSNYLDKIRQETSSAQSRMQQNTAIGTMAGAVGGGILGSVVPGLGTAAGIAGGAAAGGALAAGATQQGIM